MSLSFLIDQQSFDQRLPCSWSFIITTTLTIRITWPCLLTISSEDCCPFDGLKMIKLWEKRNFFSQEMECSRFPCEFKYEWYFLHNLLITHLESLLRIITKWRHTIHFKGEWSIFYNNTWGTSVYNCTFIHGQILKQNSSTWRHAKF